MPPVEIIISSFIVLILSLSVHEAAHAWAATRLGDPTARLLGRLTLNPVAHVDPIGTILFPLIGMTFPGAPLLGWAKPVPVNPQNLRHPRRDFALVAAAGPISNILLAIVATLVWHLLPEGEFYGALAPRGLIRRMIETNILLAAFNILPIPPLDGGNVLAGLVPEQAARVLDSLRPWGFLILYALLFAGVLDDLMLPIARFLISFLPI